MEEALVIRVHNSDSSPPRETTAGGKVGMVDRNSSVTTKTPAVLAGRFCFVGERFLAANYADGRAISLQVWEQGGKWPAHPRNSRNPRLKSFPTGVEDARRRLRTHSPDRRQLALHHRWR